MIARDHLVSLSCVATRKIRAFFEMSGRDGRDERDERAVENTRYRHVLYIHIRYLAATHGSRLHLLRTLVFTHIPTASLSNNDDECESGVSSQRTTRRLSFRPRFFSRRADERRARRKPVVLFSLSTMLLDMRAYTRNETSGEPDNERWESRAYGKRRS